MNLIIVIWIIYSVCDTLEILHSGLLQLQTFTSYIFYYCTNLPNFHTFTLKLEILSFH